MIEFLHAPVKQWLAVGIQYVKGLLANFTSKITALSFQNRNKKLFQLMLDERIELSSKENKELAERIVKLVRQIIEVKSEDFYQLAVLEIDDKIAENNKKILKSVSKKLAAKPKKKKAKKKAK